VLIRGRRSPLTMSPPAILTSSMNIPDGHRYILYLYFTQGVPIKNNSLEKMLYDQP